MTIFLGLTGSIGMGKSTTAQMFKDAGIPVHDSDATVHSLYRADAAPLIEAVFPGVVKGGVVDRKKLSQYVVGNEQQMKKLEAIIHPLVRREEQAFRKRVEGEDKNLAILDIPLLFETCSQNRVDGIIVVTAPFDIQRQRVLQREGMSEGKFKAILDRQTPDKEKRNQADFIIDTSNGLEIAHNEVMKIIALIDTKQWKRGDHNHA